MEITTGKSGVLLRISEFLNPFHGKQQRMLEEMDGEVRLQAPCMTVVNLFEMPGVVSVSEDKLMIRPGIGRPTLIGLASITHVTGTRRFNGTIRVLQFQHGFWIHGGAGWRLGFAVSDEQPWRQLFEEANIAVIDGN